MTTVLPVLSKPKSSKIWIVSVTVVGLLFLVAIVLYLGSGTIGPGLGDAPEIYTRTNMGMIEAIFANYIQDNSAVPVSSENYRLVQIFTKKSDFTRNSHTVNANQEFIDGWGTPFRFKFESKDNIVILSAGPDKIFGTPDDITNQ